MNHVLLIGRLATEPESRTTQSGILQCSFRLAVPRAYKNAQGEREADFINIFVWRGAAEICKKYMHKGMKIAVSGTLQTRSYQAQDGSKRYVTEVIASEFEFCENRREAEPADEQPQTDFKEVDDDELPF